MKIVFLIFFLSLVPSYAGAEAFNFSTLLGYALKHSPEIRESQADVSLAFHSKNIAHRSQFLPQIEFDLSEQHSIYDRPYNQNGTDISNNGSDPSIGIGLNYDLQKLFGSSSRLSNASFHYAEIKHRIQERTLIREIKQNFFEIIEASAELDLLKNQIHLFDRVDEILKKQHQLGVYNEIERQQFGIQKGLLVSQMGDQKTALNSMYAKLAIVVGMNTEDLKAKITEIKEAPPLVFADRQDLNAEQLAHLTQGDVLNGLQQDYDLAKMEYERFTPVPLPSVYFKIHREWPSMPSSEGPQTVSEAGLTFPIDALFTRSQEREKLAAKKDKESAAYDKTLAEYHSAVQLSVQKIESLKSEAKNLEKVHDQADKLLRKSFLYYSQKRLDSMGTLDIFQKSFNASKALLANKMKIEMTDANLEYLVGNPKR